MPPPRRAASRAVLIDRTACDPHRLEIAEVLYYRHLWSRLSLTVACEQQLSVCQEIECCDPNLQSQGRRSHAVDTGHRFSIDRTAACWLHADRYFGSVVRRQFYWARSATTGEPALSESVAFTYLSAPDRSIPPERSTRLCPGRYRWPLRLLRAAGRESDSLRRNRRRSGTGLVRRGHGWP